MALTSLAVQNAKPKEKPYKLSDGNGLHLLVQPNGSKLWRFRYHFAGKENMLALGSFPDVVARICPCETRCRAQADRRRQRPVAAKEARQDRRCNRGEQYLRRNRRRTSGGFERERCGGGTLNKVRWLLLDLASPLTKRPIAEITPAEILLILKRYEKSGRRDTARRLRGAIGKVCRLAVATLRRTTDPTYALQGALSGSRGASPSGDHRREAARRVDGLDRRV